jgi:hypothetical protein
MTQEHQTRSRNPFRELMVTELIDNPKLYKKMFSEQILIGETLTVFRPVNTILTGPQGSGKSMILNLLRHRVLAEYIADGSLPRELEFLKPFLGISVNLQRAYFQAFGRRSAATPRGSDPNVDASCAADYLNHLLFGEFLKTLTFLFSAQGSQLARWMKVSRAKVHSPDLASSIADWRCWYGYYRNLNTLEQLREACQHRIDTWRRFLNTTMDTVPEDVWTTKTTLGEPLHYIGNFLQDIVQRGATLPLYVVIDQYEVLPELNPTHGTNLQRVVNTLIKARDPVVFYRIGARTYDWGKELRVWGAESRIELQRDYVVIDLAEALMRNENTGRSTFRNLATDVAVKRLREENYRLDKEYVPKLFGNETPEEESRSYFGDKKKQEITRAFAQLPEEFHADVINACGKDPPPIDLRLAAAWTLQRLKSGESAASIRREIRQRPWKHNGSWRKERILPALCQLASVTRSKKHYGGWTTLVDLAGANIAAFLLLASEIWDLATKFDHTPISLEGKPISIPRQIQTDAIRAASSKWVQRDRLETTGGSKRYRIIARLGPAIHAAIVSDTALSNPGHSGFSLREIDIERSSAIQSFLHNGVSWAILEERPHTSRSRGDSTRRKYYLHPLLSPMFEIPHRRAKEPLYITFEQAQQWFTTDEPISFVGITKYRRSVNSVKQRQLFS